MADYLAPQKTVQPLPAAVDPVPVSMQQPDGWMMPFGGQQPPQPQQSPESAVSNTAASVAAWPCWMKAAALLGVAYLIWGKK